MAANVSDLMRTVELAVAERRVCGLLHRRRPCGHCPAHQDAKNSVHWLPFRLLLEVVARSTQ